MYRSRLTRSVPLYLPMQTEDGLLEYFEAILSGGVDRDAESVAVLLRMDVKALLNDRGVTFTDW